VSTGDRVREGQILGYVSHNPRERSVNHLHFQTRVNGSLTDPAPILAQASIAGAPMSIWWKLGLAGVAGVGLYWVLTRAEGRV
jgi:hypothetical protein